jgi:hypothetical protein
LWPDASQAQKATAMTTFLLAVIGGVLGWFATNWVAKPIVDARDKCLKALKAALRLQVPPTLLALADEVIE